MDSKVKKEQDGGNLPKNVPKDDYFLHDVNVNVGLIHKDDSICHSKTAWASFNKTPPLKDVKLPDFSSDNKCDDEYIGERTDETKQNTCKAVITDKKVQTLIENLEPPNVNTGKPIRQSE